MSRRTAAWLAWSLCALSLVLPLVIESLLAERLQTALRTPTKPEVEVSSNFPPELLLGRIDRIQVKMDRANLQGADATNVEANLKGVRVSVPSLLEGNPTIEANSCSIRAQAPAEEVPAMFINQQPGCLRYLGLGNGY